jgi:hypothetical protein
VAREGARLVSWSFTAEAFRWDARKELWILLTVPADVSADIDALPTPQAGFNSVKVRVRVGATRWSTSIFPSSDGLYVLPLKKAVYSKYDIGVGDPVEVELDIA